ncbi:MAG: hypothetical protein RBS07_17920 [Lentimicrobium sp.]|jgi:acetyltransferase-like isoleucine patch superfamily enzyme|nr:hypothetical protein [Lentimicrobium sp.]
MKDIVILGTGNVDIIRLIEEINSENKRFNIIGFLDKNDDLKGTVVLGYPVVGNDDLLLGKLKGVAVVNNVMQSPLIHSLVSDRLQNRYGVADFPNIIHPSINLNHTTIGHGNIIYKGVDIATKVSIGNFNIFYPSTNIGHETIVGHNNLFAINVTVGARCIVGDNIQFGNSSTISLNLTIGNNTEIGVGSVVINNVKENSRLLGYPAMDSHKVLKQFIKSNI